MVKNEGNTKFDNRYVEKKEMVKSRKRKLNGWTKFDVVVMILAALVCLVTLYPMIYVVSCSFSEPKKVMAGEVVLLPKGFSTKAYEIVCTNMSFWRSMGNSVFYVVVGCILMLLTTIVVAYPLTRPNLKFRKVLTYYLLIPMYFGGGMIPSFLVVTKLGMYNTIWALILPGCYSIWNIILCRTFMASLPVELIDAAQIDGSDQFRTLTRIVIPLSKPVLAVILIYTIVGIWNSWFGASIYTTREELQPVQLYLRNILASTSSGTSMDLLTKGLPQQEVEKLLEMSLAANQIKYAMIVIITLPIVAVYPMFQKHFTKGIMLGSLKG